MNMIMNMPNNNSPDLSVVQGMQEAVKLKTHAAQKRTLMTKARKDFKVRSGEESRTYAVDYCRLVDYTSTTYIQLH